jgi:hypothetical protein
MGKTIFYFQCAIFDAGRSLVLVSQKNQDVGERLFNLLCTPIDGEIAASALLTLFFGWPTFPGLSSLIAQAKKSSVPVLRAAAVLCAVRSGSAQDEDLERLLPLAESRSFLYSSCSNEIAQALIEGAPSSDKLFKIAIGSCATGPERRLDSEIAKAYVVATSHLKAIGPFMDPTRQAGVAGLVALNRLDIFRDLREEHNSQSLDVALYFPENRTLIAYLARNWGYVKSVFGDSSFERISRHGGNHWYAWDHFASYVGESEALRDEFISYCAQETKALSSSGLEALSRLQPRSHLLLEHCLRAIDGKPIEDTNSSPLDRTRRALVVGQILGRQFSDSQEIRETLEQRVHLQDCVSVVGLSLGWPSSDALGEIYDDIHKNGWARQQVIWASALQIANVIGSTEEFKYLLEFILSNGTGHVWEFLDFCAPVVTARLKKDDALTSYYLEKLRIDATSDHKASLPSLLVSSIGLSDELKELCETSYAEQCARGQLSESGLDIAAARIRPVAHSLLDVLVPRTN